MLTRWGHVVELAQQLFKRLPHIVVRNLLSVKVGFGKALRHEIQAVFFSKLVQGGGKAEFFKDVAHILGEAVNHGFQVVAHVVWGLRDIGQRKFGRVEERVTTDGRQHFVQVIALITHSRMSRQDGFAGGLQYAIEAAKDGEGKNDLAVFVFFEGTAKQFGVFPDEIG